MSSQPNPILSLCVIAKNEEKTIHRCLSSVKEFVDEIVLVDTGSQDQTVQIAESLGAKVSHLKWIGDFSFAKNHAIDHARGDWILFLDADEELAQRDAKKLKSMLKEAVLFGFSLIQRTYLLNGYSVQSTPNPLEYDIGREYSDCIEIPVIRLFKNDKRIRYQGKVHEVVERAFENHGLLALPSQIVIHHYGKVLDQQHVEKKKKLYLELGYQKLAESPRNAMAHYELGVQLYELKRFEECVHHFKTAFELNPEMTLCLLAMAKAYHLMLDMDQAGKYYEKCVKEHPGHLLFYEYANFLRDQGHFKAAIKFYNLCLEQNPNYAFALFNLGGVYLRMNRREQGFQYIEKAIRQNPDNETLLINYARLALAGDQMEASIRHLERFLSRFPQNSRSNIYLSQLYIKKGDYHSALKWTDQIIALDPQNALARLLKGNALCGLHELDAAKTEYLQVLEQEPRNLETLLKLAMLAEMQGEQDESFSYYENILRIDPDQPFALKKMAAKVGRTRTDDKAVELLWRASSRNPDDSECLMLLGNLLEKRGEYNQAKVVYESGILKIPKIEPLLRRKLTKLMSQR
jgi:tetratricopeptide (TPR) repeat protein